MSNQKDIQEELRKVAPDLSKVKKTELFEAPEGYFESLPQLLQEQIQEKKQQHQPFWERLLQPQWSGSLAVVLIITGIALYFFQKANPSDELTTTDIESYIEIHIDDFDESALAAEAGPAGSFTVKEELEPYLDEYLLQDIDEENLESFF